MTSKLVKVDIEDIYGNAMRQLLKITGPLWPKPTEAGFQFVCTNLLSKEKIV